MASIHFFEEEISYVLKDKDKHIAWISKLLQNEGYDEVAINYIFCSDDYLLNINQQYLNHDTYTDIITFDNADEEGKIESDIFISIDRITANAKLANATEANELRRVMIHGILHLIGYSDKTDEEKAVMRQKEDACLSLYK